ncbi:hypothetical protein DAETH_36970 (plasmid) [Deinococcus aetherius]|uniref:ADP-ribosylglycohydrolase n=1 Tax=Deinococcus aetherius TaxID=200252 RepID=A0ABN6RLW8_9DEIO|nr:ADP-ribosylglycohydrolase family protein [Deinococcus aetherius]BDP43728.1 hypothetical protein DAETH_36970 [Deinococcus aetherius]
MNLPADYARRVYAGVLGKMIGVYLGRPIEGWTHERIERELGEVDRYVSDRLGLPLVVTDDDLSGTFTFLRALEDHGFPRDITSEQIGETWLNYIIEDRTVLWWGGVGLSTEQTAFRRLQGGVPAPSSGSRELNGPVVSEQIGAQIFIDGWGMVAPGRPELAADLAARAARVSHDGEAVYAAQVIAAMEAQAFVEPDLGRLLDRGLSVIPRDSLIARVIRDLRAWRSEDQDWRRSRARLQDRYGYHRFGGACHVVPNHALVWLGLLYGDGDFRRSLMITNTSGWDTDCNSGNVGCLLGIRNGLTAFEGAYDWRGPVRDRLYLPTADGGRAITDALTEAGHIVRAGRALVGLPHDLPKGGARFHFSQPGSVQGFTLGEEDPAGGTLDNVAWRGERVLALRWAGTGPDQRLRATTSTFISPDALRMPGYELLASPTLYPGQVVRVRVSADESNATPVTIRPCVGRYSEGPGLEPVLGPGTAVRPGGESELVWRVPDTGGQPVADVGIEVTCPGPGGAVYLHTLTWDGTPDVCLGRPAGEGTVWRRAWVDAVHHWEALWPEAYRIAQDTGRGLLIQGARDWHDYQVSAAIRSDFAAVHGLAARVQGLRRYYALTLRPSGVAQLIKVRGTEQVLAQTTVLPGEQLRDFNLELDGPRLRAFLDRELLFEVVDDDPISGGGVALLVEEGMLACDAVRVLPTRTVDPLQVLDVARPV